jgi:hypothetical protein
MSIKSEPYYWVECDWEGCGLSASEGGDYSAWKQPDGAVEDAAAGDWLTVTSADGTERHYCNEHTHWSEDEDETVPGPVVPEGGE